MMPFYVTVKHIHRKPPPHSGASQCPLCYSLTFYGSAKSSSFTTYPYSFSFQSWVCELNIPEKATPELKALQTDQGLSPSDCQELEGCKLRVKIILS